MLKNKKMITMISALCALATIGGVSAVNANAAATTLEGFTCAGASVNAEEVGVRFEFKLEGSAVSKSALEAGVVYMPYDLYTGDVNDLTKETFNVATAEFGWEAITETQDEDYVGYAELPASAIPANQYNRILLVRGYIEDGANVYYTAPVKTSMAYSAWKGAEALPQYAEALKAYMGPYTLTSDAGNVENLYYGDTVAGLPTQKDGKNIVKWFWDAEKTNEIQPTDYATGSMNVYYEIEKFAVSGTVSGASNLESVKVYANDKEVGAVAANGEYTVWLEAGEYELTFANEDYIAYADVEVSAAVTKDVTLSSNAWVPGQYGTKVNVKTFKTNYDKNDVLDGSFTVTTTEGTNGMIFPNVATTSAFVYELDFSNVTRTGDDAEANFGVAITTGWWVLSISFQRWEPVVINMCEGMGPAFVEYWNSSAHSGYVGAKLKVVRTADKIEIYNHGVLYCTFTSGAFTPSSDLSKMNWDEGNSNFRNKWASNSASFFGEEAELTVGIIGLKAIGGYTATCSMKEFATVSGQVSVPQGTELDLTKTTMSVGGVSCNMTIDAQGNYTALVPEGTQTFEFKNGTWGATVVDVVVSLGATNTVNATLVDYKWAPGTFNGNAGSASGYDKNDIDGSITVDGRGVSVVFPNTATTGAFTYEATLSNVSRSNDEASPGIGITCGDVTVGITFRAWTCLTLNVNTSTTSADEEKATYINPGVVNYANGTVIRIVRTAEDIKFYAKGTLIVTLTATGYTLADGMTNYGWGDNFTSNWNANAAKFFNGANLCAEITNGTKYSCSATYTCTFTNN